MPELAEVETIVRFLKSGTADSPGIVGKIITSLKIHWYKTLAAPDLSAAENLVIQKKVENVARHGKFIRIELSGDTFIFIHLRMSGDLKVVRAGAEEAYKHIRAEILFNDGYGLIFNDPRKFGRIWITRSAADVTGHLGYDPFDIQLTPSLFHELLISKSRQIKPLLLDQTILAGIGNIYSDESLHLAKIHPLRISSSLSFAETDHLLQAIREVLQEGIRRNGSSIDWVYRGGEYQNHFRVYGRKGEPCPVCGTPIARILVGQRGTHYCPNCQPEEVVNEM